MLRLIKALFHFPPLRRQERATLRYSYAGEVGRGSFAALRSEFALLVATACFGVTNTWLLCGLASAMFIGMIASLFSSSLTARHRKRGIMLATEMASRVVVIAAAFSTSGPAFVITMGVGIALNAQSLPLSSGIYSANFRDIVRGEALGRLMTLGLLAMAATSALAGWAMGVDRQYFRVLLIGVSAASLLCSWYGNRKLPEPRPRRRTGRHVGWRHYLRVVRDDRVFVYMEAVWFLTGLCNLWLMPVRVLRLQNIAFSEFQIMLATVTAGSLTIVLMLGLWGRVIYRVNFGLYRMILSALFLTGILIFFHSRSFPMVCFGSVVWGMAMAGGMLSWRLIATFFTHPGRAPMYMAIHVFLCGVRGVLGPALSLNLHERYGAQFVGNLSAAGFALSIPLLIPIFLAMRRG